MKPTTHVIARTESKSCSEPHSSTISPASIPVRTESGVSTGAVAAGLSEPGRQYALYLHHGKAVGTRSYVATPGKHQQTLTFNFPAGEYLFEWIQPADGKVLGTEKFTHSGGARKFSTPVYSLDLALRVRHVSEVR